MWPLFSIKRASDASVVRVITETFYLNIIFQLQYNLWVSSTRAYLSGMNLPLFIQKGRRSNRYLSLKSEQKSINSHKVVQHNETTNPKGFSKNMYKFLKIWHTKEIKKNFFFASVYMKMSWTFNYLKCIRIQPIFWKKEREKEKKKKGRKKTKIFSFSFYFFMYIQKWTRRLGQYSDFILILSNRSR